MVPNTPLTRPCSWSPLSILVSITFCAKCDFGTLEAVIPALKHSTERPPAEQFIIIDEPNQDDSTPTTEKSHRVLVVPTAAVGASALRKTYPKVISFSLPDGKVGSEFTEKFGKASADPEETCRGLVTRVFNEQLAPHKKSVIDISSAAAAEESDGRLVCDTVFRKGKTAVKPVAGKLLLLLSYSPICSAPSHKSSRGHYASK